MNDWGNDPIKSGSPPVNKDTWGTDPLKSDTQKSSESAPKKIEFPRDDPQYGYGSVLPISWDTKTGEYAGLAAPEIVRSPARGLMDIIGRLYGPLTPDKMKSLNPDEMGLVMMMGGMRTSPAGAVDATAATAASQMAHDAGYVLPPVEALEGQTSTVGGLLSGWSGKIKTQQAASERNQVITNSLAPKALGLPEDTHLDADLFHRVRDEASKAYQAVADAVPTIKTDVIYNNKVSGLGGRNSLAVQYFPEITKNQDLHALVGELLEVPEFPTQAGLEVVRELRHSANANFKAIGDPSKHALAIAQRQAADAIDELMDRNIWATGQTGLIDAYRAARAQIAKSYDLEGATNSVTGDVSARGLARLAAKGRPLTGELKTIADTATAFPKAMQSPALFGRNEDWSALDFFGAAGSMAAGHPGAAGAVLARPVARKIILSGPYQSSIIEPRKVTVSPYLRQLMNPGLYPSAQPDAQSAASTLGIQ